jgi:DNA polymerase (family X)
MINLKLADIFANIGELKKSIPGKEREVLSLMSAARTLRDDPVIMERIINGEDFRRLSGIDPYCFNLIREYLDNGSVREYDSLISKYSDDLIKLIRITGLGRKRILNIYQYFNIKDLDGLKDIFEEKKSVNLYDREAVRDILTPFFIKRIQRSLKYYESLKGKTPRWPSEYFAKKILNSLEGLSQVKKAHVTGSIRRKKRLVGDMDILVLPFFNESSYDFTKGSLFLKDIEKLDFIKKIISIKRTENDISASYETVYEIDMEIILAGERTWYWQLFKTTGSRDHLLNLKKHAAANGLRDPLGSPLSGFSSEKDIYRFYGLEFIPVELRQGRDEIELSSMNRLPDLLSMEDIKGDLHIHSEWSDGLIEYSDMIDTAEKLGYEYIAISDHSGSNRYGNGLDAGRLLKKMDFIDKLRRNHNEIEILMGAEIDVRKPGVFDYPADIINKLDIAIASLHSNFDLPAEENTGRAVSAVGKDYFDLLAHPTATYFGNRAPLFIDIDRVIEASANSGCALEINSYYMRLDLNEENARKAGIAGSKLAINTDSHRPGNMEMIRLGVDIARRAGLEAKDIINTMTAAELKKWHNERKKAPYLL